MAKCVNLQADCMAGTITDAAVIYKATIFGMSVFGLWNIYFKIVCKKKKSGQSCSRLVCMFCQKFSPQSYQNEISLTQLVNYIHLDWLLSIGTLLKNLMYDHPLLIRNIWNLCFYFFYFHISIYLAHGTKKLNWNYQNF